jgi:uncharacterized membrane protein YkvA (DUF1232 family)
VPIPIPAPVRRLFEQCEIGFTLGRKLKLTGLLMLYLIFPIDLIPEFIPVLGLMDDLVALALLIRVWCSPVLKHDPAHSTASQAVIRDEVPR